MVKKIITTIIFAILYMIVTISISRLFFSEQNVIVNSIIIAIIAVAFLSVYFKIINKK